MKLVNKLTVVSLLKDHAFKDWVLDKLMPLINDLEREVIKHGRKCNFAYGN